MVKCSRTVRNKECQREGKYQIETIGFEFNVCWLHRITNPFCVLWGNIQIRNDFKKYNIGIDWPLLESVFQKRKVD